MEIQKEREAFEAYMAEKYKSLMDRRKCLNNGGGYMAWDMNVAWQVWQAPKAQAVPEGFVLVPKEPSADLVNHGHQVFLGHFNEGGQTGGRSLYFAYKAMIELQEPAND